MSYESRVYDKNHGDGFDDGFGPDPVVVLVVTGTHDVSRFVNLLNGGTPLVEQVGLAKKITQQVNRAKGGRLALSLLKRHGGPDLLEPVAVPAAAKQPLVRKYLAAERAERGMRQEDLASEIGVTRNTIIKLESGLAVDEGIEGKIERFFGWELGSLDAIRNGGRPSSGKLMDMTTRPRPGKEWAVKHPGYTLDPQTETPARWTQKQIPGSVLVRWDHETEKWQEVQ